MDSPFIKEQSDLIDKQINIVNQEYPIIKYELQKIQEQYNQIKILMKNKCLDLIEKSVSDNDLSSRETRDIIKDYYDFAIFDIKIDNAINYIKYQRSQGKKIMMIIGAVPEQEYKFNISEDHIPIYFEYGLIVNRKDYKSNILNPLKATLLNHVLNIDSPFGEYPLLWCDGLYKPILHGLFDIIIFDSGTVFWNNIDKQFLLNLFKYTYDDTSIVVIDNQSNTLGNFINTKNKLQMPLYSYEANINSIIDALKIWFNINFPNQIVYHPNIENINYFYNNNKLHVFFNNNNIYHVFQNNVLNLYFTHTKQIY